jgi:hypothetical protein
MSVPRRWLDGSDDLTPDERQALAADLGRQAPRHAKRAVRAALSLKLSAAAAAAAAPSALRGATQKGAAAKLVGLSVLKSAAVAFALSAVVSAGFSLRERHDAARDASGSAARRPPPASSAHELLAPANSATTLQPEPRSTPTDAAQGRGLRRALSREPASEPPSPPASAAVSESQRVAEARALLRSGRAAGALAALQALERDEPNGLLTQEREALSIESLAALGQRETARKRAALFAVRYPTSPHLSAVRRAAE